VTTSLQLLVIFAKNYNDAFEGYILDTLGLFSKCGVQCNVRASITVLTSAILLATASRSLHSDLNCIESHTLYQSSSC